MNGLYLSRMSLSPLSLEIFLQEMITPHCDQHQQQREICLAWKEKNREIVTKSCHEEHIYFLYKVAIKCVNSGQIR